MADDQRAPLPTMDAAKDCPCCAAGYPVDENGVHVSPDRRWWEPCKARRPIPSPA